MEPLDGVKGVVLLSLQHDLRARDIERECHGVARTFSDFESSILTLCGYKTFFDCRARWPPQDTKHGSNLVSYVSILDVSRRNLDMLKRPMKPYYR